tara:strand:+ start:1126 stop:2010 length:885 start_codon:yes stop_codon:yes gene_type:complete
MYVKMAYASNIDRLTDSISNLGQENATNVAQLRSQFEEQESKVQDKEQKTQEASSIDEGLGIPLILGGGGALATGKLVKKGVETGTKLAKAGEDLGTKLVKEVGETGTKLAKAGEDLADTARTGARAGARAGQAFASTGNIQDAMLVASDEANVSGLAETGVQKGLTTAGKSLARVAGRVLPEGTLKDAATTFGKTAAETAAETGETAVTGEIATGTLASLDIPVIGEGIALVGGLALIGDSIYNLFHKHHQAAPPAPPGISQLQIPQLLTHKFSSAVPSIDTATDRSGGMINF